jgi:hypothetical protein
MKKQDISVFVNELQGSAFPLRSRKEKVKSVLASPHFYMTFGLFYGMCTF